MGLGLGQNLADLVPRVMEGARDFADGHAIAVRPADRSVIIHRKHIPNLRKTGWESKKASLYGGCWGGSVLGAHFAPGWVRFRRSLPDDLGLATSWPAAILRRLVARFGSILATVTPIGSGTAKCCAEAKISASFCTARRLRQWSRIWRGRQSARVCRHTWSRMSRPFRSESGRGMRGCDDAGQQELSRSRRLRKRTKMLGRRQPGSATPYTISYFPRTSLGPSSPAACDQDDDDLVMVIGLSRIRQTGANISPGAGVCLVYNATKQTA
jgi:hypothetical protein